MAEVLVRDEVIWIAHVRGDDALVRRLTALAGGEQISLEVDGAQGVWQKMSDGRDGRPTPGLKPTDPQTLSYWRSLRTRKAESVSIEAASSAVEPNPAHEGGRVGEPATFILKVNRLTASADGSAMTEAPRYRKANPQAGDRLYLWLNEGAGGEGLCGIATVRAVNDADPVMLAIDVASSRPARPLTKAMLAPHRSTGEMTALGGLAAKLYRHSLSKVAALDGVEAAYLAAYFPPADP